MRSKDLGSGIMKKVALRRYWLCDIEDLPKSYVKQAERQLKQLAKLIGPDDKKWDYMKQYHPEYRTIYEDLVVKKYERKNKKSRKQQATSLTLL